MKYLLDTNVVSDPLRPTPSPAISQRLARHAGEMAIPAPVWHELRFGCARLPPSRRRMAIERYVKDVVRASFPVLDYDQPAADWHALERARLTAMGNPTSFVDGQIAAIAYVNDLILVTANTRDFEQYENLDVRSWA
ncbi:MAG: type II toxin-antitoxin system VapC family toxin [Gammaproteobacteria bacterium]|nr:type II toxin-antitoxin system VapC family toxin [Gammaproteobacteria bacterium]